MNAASELHFFLNPNELGPVGWQAMRSIILAGERVVCWAPATLHLDECRRSDPLLPTSDELLWYVEHSHLRIMGRKWWFYNDKQRQEHKWALASFVKGFDDRLVEQMAADVHRKQRDKRVWVVDEEDGYEWARKVLASGVSPEEVLRTMQIGAMPPGIREKMDRQASDEDRAVVALRDIRNYFRSRDDADVRHIYGRKGDFEFFSRVIAAVGSPVDVRRSAHPRPNQQIHVPIERLAAALQASIDAVAKAERAPKSSAESFDRTKSILSNADALTELRDHDRLVLSALSSLPTDEDAAELYVEDLIRRIDAGVAKSTARELLKLGGPARAMCFLGGLAVATVDLALSGGSGIAVLGLGLTAMDRGVTVLEGVSAVPDRSYTGPRWPLLLAYGAQSVSRRRIRKIVRELNRPPRN